MSDIIVRAIGTEDLDDIARIHKASFDDRALTQLGKGAVKRYYRWLLTGFAEIYPICAATKGGVLAGFCFAGVYAGSFSGFLQENKWHLVGSVLLRPWLMFNPLVRDQAALAIKTLKHLFRKRRKNKQKLRFDNAEKEKAKIHPNLGILSIAVNPAFQRQGIGELMMGEVENRAKANGFSQLHLSVHPENLPAVRFYEKLGWQKNLQDGNWDGKMWKKLN